MSRYSDLLRYYDTGYIDAPMNAEAQAYKNYDDYVLHGNNDTQDYVSKASENKGVLIPFQNQEQDQSTSKYVRPTDGKVTFYNGISRKDFTAQNYDYFNKAFSSAGYNPVVALAQGILEGGVRRGGGAGSGSAAALKDMALFGVKSHGKAGGKVRGTWEHEGDGKVKKPDSFRTYTSYEDSVADQIDFFNKNSRRYRPLTTSKTLGEYMVNLQNSGYATDPNYLNKLGTIITKDIIQNLPSDELRVKYADSMITGVLGNMANVDEEVWVKGKDGKSVKIKKRFNYYNQARDYLKNKLIPSLPEGSRAQLLAKLNTVISSKQ